MKTDLVFGNVHYIILYWESRENGAVNIEKVVKGWNNIAVNSVLIDIIVITAQDIQLCFIP